MSTDVTLCFFVTYCVSLAQFNEAASSVMIVASVGYFVIRAIDFVLEAIGKPTIQAHLTRRIKKLFRK